LYVLLFYSFSICFSRVEIGEKRGKVIAKRMDVWYNILVRLFDVIYGGAKG